MGLAFSMVGEVFEELAVTYSDIGWLGDDGSRKSASAAAWDTSISVFIFLLFFIFNFLVRVVS